MVTPDMAHVLLDGLNALRAGIEAGDEPWKGYDGDEDDPKLTAEGYEELIEAAETALNEVVEQQS